MRAGPDHEWDRADRAARALEDDWGHGEPSLEEHWGRQGPGAPPIVLAALVKADLRCRFARGQRPAVVEYLGRFPALRDLRDRVVSLVYEEYCLREERGEPPDPERFCARYEPWRDSLESQLRYHRMLSQVAGAVPPKPRFPDPGEHFLKFRLCSILGRGGDALVFLAHDEELGDRPVALKVSSDRGREPAIMGRLNHPHIVPILSVKREEHSGLRALCMPYQPGRPLHEVIRRVDPASRPRHARTLREAAVPDPDPGDDPGDVEARDCPGWAGFPRDGTYAEAAAWVVLTLARALGHAHAKGILHRDVKPANVLLTVRDGPQLLDFNLAFDPHAVADQAQAALHGGTLPYMAPEQLRAFLDPDRMEDVGPAADLYALGLVLVELLTGRRPEAPDPALPLPRALAELVDRRAGPPAWLRTVEPPVPPALAEIAARCLAPLPRDRFASARDLAIALEGVLDHPPAPVRSAPAPARSLARRRRAWLVPALGLLLAAPLVAAPSRLDRLRVLATVFPGSATIRADLGFALLKAGQAREARAAFQEATRIVPSASASVGLGLALEADGQSDKAQDTYDLVAKEHPDDALAALQAGVNADPRSALLHTALGLALGREGRWKEARAEFDRAVQLDPRLYPPHQALADIAANRDGDFDQSFAHMSKAIAIAEGLSKPVQRDELAELYRVRANGQIQHATLIQGVGRASAEADRRADQLYRGAQADLKRARDCEPVAKASRAAIAFSEAIVEMGLGRLAAKGPGLAEARPHFEAARGAVDRCLEDRPGDRMVLDLRQKLDDLRNSGAPRTGHPALSSIAPRRD